MPIFEYKCGRCGKVTEFLEPASGIKKHVCHVDLADFAIMVTEWLIYTGPE
jgi:hypothetical protein